MKVEMCKLLWIREYVSHEKFHANVVIKKLKIKP